MGGARTRLMAFAIFALVLAWPVFAEAAVRVVAPQGWSESGAAAPAAQRRASRWTDTLGLRMTQVVSAPSDDRFVETIAVFEGAEPVPEQVFDSPAAALEAVSRVVSNLVGARPADEFEIRSTASGHPIAWARWTVDELNFECALAPSGDTTSVVIGVTLASELGEQRERLDAMFNELEGVSAPMPRFSLLAWRLGSFLVWLVLGLGLHMTMLRVGDQEDDHATAGRRAALANGVLIIAGTIGAHVFLQSRELAIVHAGSSLGALTMWIGVAGIVVVGVHISLAGRLDRGVVQSAPASGAFASGTFSTADVMRSVSRSGVHVRPNLGDLRTDPRTDPRTHLGGPGSPPAFPPAGPADSGFGPRPDPDISPDPGASASASTSTSRIVIDEGELE